MFCTNETIPEQESALHATATMHGVSSQRVDKPLSIAQVFLTTIIHLGMQSLLVGSLAPADDAQPVV
jgi:hypothetical protein